MSLALSLPLALVWAGLWVRMRFFAAAEDPPVAPLAGAWPTVVAIVPARNEADGIGAAVRSLLGQDYPGALRLVVVDDQSDDGTAGLARAAAASLGAEDRLIIVPGAPLPPGWVGKMWAVEQGVRTARAIAPDAAFLLLTDADIDHHRTNLAELVARAEVSGLDLASLMVRLSCVTGAERLMIPAFVYFFRLLYPFHHVADPESQVAAAAGGCMLLRRTALERIGGIAALKGALIDDCTLAKLVKRSGGAIWLGLTARTVSLRRYTTLDEILHMIRRSAYEELDHSPLKLAGAVLGLMVLYWGPLVLGWPLPLALLLMLSSIVPMLRFYRQSPLWALLLPVTATLYLWATLDSARRHYAGAGGEWKGRVQAGREPA